MQSQIKMINNKNDATEKAHYEKGQESLVTESDFDFDSDKSSTINKSSKLGKLEAYGVSYVEKLNTERF